MPELSISTIKLNLASVTGVSSEILHVYIGLAIFGLALLFLHNRHRLSFALIIVLFLALFNEFIDFQHVTAVGDPWNWFDTTRDIILSISAPAILMLLAKYQKIWREWQRTA